MQKCALVATLVIFHGLSAAQAQEAGGTSASSGVFTTEQAKNGERAYEAQCATCHGSDLLSTDVEAPDLTARAFKLGWNGKTIANRFEQIRKTMPPGTTRLDDQTYLDIVTYILQFNGIPAGNQKLVPDISILEKIVIAIP